MTMLAAEEIRRFGLVPKVALVSHSSFGTSDAPSAMKMREALRIIHEKMPQLECEGEMHGDAALSEEVRMAAFPNSRLKGDANLLIMPTLEAANKSLRELLAAHPAVREHAHLRVGVPAQDIVSEALALDADIILMGAVSRRRLERWFIGNTAEAVLDRVPCNVWIEKPQPPA